MKLIITALLALVLILTIINKIVSLFRPQRSIEIKWLFKGLAISGILLLVALIHFYLNRDNSPSGAGIVAAVVLFAVFADQYRIQRSYKNGK